jgi:hypothetical protein
MTHPIIVCTSLSGLLRLSLLAGVLAGLLLLSATLPCARASAKPRSLAITSPAKSAKVKGRMKVTVRASRAYKRVRFGLDRRHIWLDRKYPFKFRKTAYLDTSRLKRGKHRLWVAGRRRNGDLNRVSRVFYVQREKRTSRPPGGPTLPPPAPSPPSPPPSPPVGEPVGLFPELPTGASLIRRDDYENGTVGASYTANQCTASNNRVANDPYGGGYGKVWEGWWDPGDPPVAGHDIRCEQGQWDTETGRRLHRDVFAIPSDSWIPTGRDGYWHQRIQLHGQNPLTSPPIAMHVRRHPTDITRFQLRFMCGDGTCYWTPWMGSFSRDAWHGVQVNVNWSSSSSGWVEFHVDGAGVIGNDGTLRQEGATLRAVSQGTPSSIYKKYGIDAGQGDGTVSRIHHFHALSEGYTVP